MYLILLKTSWLLGFCFLTPIFSSSFIMLATWYAERALRIHGNSYSYWQRCCVVPAVFTPFIAFYFVLFYFISTFIYFFRIFCV